MEPFNLSRLEEVVSFDSSKIALSRIPITHGRTKFSIFRSGAVVSRASKSIAELEDDTLKLHDYLEEFRLELDLEYTITNIVAFAKLELRPLNLLALANKLPTSSYDPTASRSESGRPGCKAIVYALTKGKPRKTILIFSSSAITLTGFRSIPDLKNQIRQFNRLLTELIEQYPEVVL